MAEPKTPTETELLDEARNLRATVKGFTDFVHSDAVPPQWKGKGIVLVGELHDHVNSNVIGYLTASACAATGKEFKYGIEADDDTAAKALKTHNGKVDAIIAKNPDLKNANPIMEGADRQVATLMMGREANFPRHVLNPTLCSTLGKVVGIDPIYKEVAGFGGHETDTPKHDLAMARGLAQHGKDGMLMAHVGLLHVPGIVEALHARGIPVLVIDAGGKLPDPNDPNIANDPESSMRFAKLRMLREAGISVQPTLGKNEMWNPDGYETHTVETYRRAMRALATDMIPEVKQHYFETIDKHVPKNLKDNVPKEEASVQPPAQGAPSQEQAGQTNTGFDQLISEALRLQLAAPLQGTAKIGSYASTPAKPLSPNERIV